jgi:hypothetical protein
MGFCVWLIPIGHYCFGRLLFLKQFSIFYYHNISRKIPVLKAGINKTINPVRYFDQIFFEQLMFVYMADQFNPVFVYFRSLAVLPSL